MTFVEEVSLHVLSLGVLSRTLLLAPLSLKAGTDTKPAEILGVVRQEIHTKLATAQLFHVISSPPSH